MKKIVAISIIIFFSVLLFIFAYGLFFGINKNGGKEKTIDSKDQAGIREMPSLSMPNKTNSPLALSLAEVSRHNTESDCWLIIKNKIYDASSYIKRHPGGSNKIISRCGTDLIDVFSLKHSNSAWNTLNKYYLGDLNSVVSIVAL